MLKYIKKDVWICDKGIITVLMLEVAGGYKVASIWVFTVQ